jgi:hypothetical protein
MPVPDWLGIGGFFLILRRRTKLFLDTLELIQISLVLLLILDLLPDTLKDPDSGRVVVDATGSTEGSLDDGRRRDQIVGEAVVQTALDFEQILGLLEELNVAFGEGFKGLLVRGGGRRASEGWGDPANGRPGAEESSECGGRAHSWRFKGEKEAEDRTVLGHVWTRSESDVCSVSFLTRIFAQKYTVCSTALFSIFCRFFRRFFPCKIQKPDEGRMVTTM